MVINEIVNRYYDTNSRVYVSKQYFEKDNLKIKKVGLVKVPTRHGLYIDCMAHYDIIALCEDDKFYIVNEQIISVPKQQFYLRISPVLPVKTNNCYQFILDKWLYEFKKLYPVKIDITLGMVQELYFKLYALPYNLLNYNCRHRTKILMNYISEYPKKLDKINTFEPLKFIKNFFIESFNYSLEILM